MVSLGQIVRHYTGYTYNSLLEFISNKEKLQDTVLLDTGHSLTGGTDSFNPNCFSAQKLEASISFSICGKMHIILLGVEFMWHPILNGKIRRNG